MPRPKLLVPNASLNVHIDPGLKARVDELLYSELEERVPHGAYQRFFNLLLSQALSSRSFDLAPFLGIDPGVAVIRATPEVIARLKAHLEQK